MGPVVSEGIKRNLFLVKCTQRAWDRIYPPSQRRGRKPGRDCERERECVEEIPWVGPVGNGYLLPIKEDAAFAPRRELSIQLNQP
jgi:hypothetical protein